MYLKRIELHGFKSFADRTELEFGAGRTTIVGPNGCGKSNVLDAMRWVLGEQSARTLRGTKMLDVIFAGSRSRKPAGFAEVNLTFDNQDGFLPRDEREVTVSRLLYRSGESEYRINGKRCRMKDIRELLLDTGVGVDAYSIIEQGRVDALLQANPVERREIFEEAAGVSRYRVRRAEAQRKLERTQNNLLRLSDVLEELERRLRSVKLAAGKARRFQEYDERLRELRSAYSLSELYRLELARGEHEQAASAASDRLQGHRAELAQHDADAAELHQRAQELDEQIQTAEEELRRLETEQSAVGERISQGERRLQDLVETRDRQRDVAEQVSGQMRDIEQRIEESARELETLAQTEQEKAASIALLEAKRKEAADALHEARRVLEQQRTAAFEAARHASRLRNERENLQQQLTQLRGRAESYRTRQEQIAAQNDTLGQRRGELIKRTAELDQQSSDLAEEVRGSEAACAKLEEESTQIKRDIAEQKETRSGVVSQLELLRDLERRREGIGQGARWVLDWKNDDGTRPDCVVGLVADVLQIDDPRVSALGPVLGQFEHHVVVRDAHAFMAELQRRGEAPGPVGIIALDRLSGGRMPHDYREAPGFLGAALDWVRCEDQYCGLAESLLARVYVVDEFERALALAQSAPAEHVFVTLDGAAVTSGGRISLGGAKAPEGLISRKTQIRQLETQLDELETAIERAHREHVEIEQRVADLGLQRESVIQRLATVQRQHADAQTELVRLQDEFTRVERETTTLRSESAEVQRDLDGAEQRLQQAEVELQAIEEQQGDHEARVGRCEEESTALEASLSETARELTAAQIELSRATERREAREVSVQELRDRRESLVSDGARAGREAEEAIERIRAAEAEREQAQTRQTALRDEITQQRESVVELRQERQTLRGRVEAGGVLSRQIQRQIEEADQQLHECQVALRESEVRKETLISRVAEELSLDLLALFEGYEPGEEDWEAIKAEMDDLRGKISRLGNVNLDAITELEELTPRYEHIVVQRDDLMEAVARLEKLIAELDEESRTRFLSCFEEVREKFLELFRKLFGGGKADIVLEDAERPLECGIEIIARPPGKEPRSISLLSGGEKTMTAVALLFAVFKRKPSPFCVLDEVDAALDESNIDRFNNMLDEFLTQSQFILITHSKRTMQCSEVLYGVTMQEPGVSKRVSVRFEDRVETPSVA